MKKTAPFYIVNKNYSREYIPQCRRFNNKASKDDLEYYLLDFGVGKDFLNRTRKTLIGKNSSSSRREKRPETDWSKIFTKNQRSTIPRYTKNSSKSVKKKVRQPTLKHGQQT